MYLECGLVIVLISLILYLMESRAHAQERDPMGEEVVTIHLTQWGSLAAERETKLFAGPSRNLPTGVYKKPGEAITINVSPTDQKELPRVAISDPILKGYRDGNAEGMVLQPGENVLSMPEGGVVHLINESPPTAEPPVVTIAGGTKLACFVLGRHTLADWQRMLALYRDVPAIELVGNRVMITAGYETARDIDDPIGLLQYIDEAIAVQDKVSGLDAEDPDPRHRPCPYRQHMRENNSPGTYMYMYYNHTGYNSAAMKTILNTQNFTQDGWGPWHELGHTYQQRPWKWDVVGEVTVNIYSLFVQRHFGNQSRLEAENYYDKAFAYLQQPTKDFNKIEDHFVKLVMFWQLALAFGDDFYPQLHRVYREMPPWQHPTNDHGKIQTFIIISSQVVGVNLSPFFEMWGLAPDKATKEQIHHLPVLARPLWKLRDRNVQEF